MRRSIALFALLAVLSLAPSVLAREPKGGGYYDRYYDSSYKPAVGYHYVQPSYRNNGYYQTNADNSFYNNWSTVGNTNPITGMPGYKTPPVRAYYPQALMTIISGYGPCSEGGS